MQRHFSRFLLRTRTLGWLVSTSTTPANTPACQTEARGPAGNFLDWSRRIYQACAWSFVVRCAVRLSPLHTYSEGALFAPLRVPLKRCSDAPPCRAWAIPHTVPPRKAAASSGDCSGVADLPPGASAVACSGGVVCPSVSSVSRLLGRLLAFGTRDTA